MIRSAGKHVQGLHCTSRKLAHLVTKCMTANDNGVFPPWDGARNALEDDGLAEHGPTEDVSDRPIRALPHLLEVELLHARLVGRDRRTFNADAVLEDRLGGLNRHAVCRLSMKP